MPVSKQSTIAFTIYKINLDMLQGTMIVTFLRTIDGAQDGTVEAFISGQEMLNLIATQATAGQPLGDEITTALYSYAVGKGLITGTIS